MQAMEDNTLLSAFQQGEPSADKTIFDRFFELLNIYAQRPIEDLATAEDIAVDALVKAIDRLGHFFALPKPCEGNQVYKLSLLYLTSRLL